MLTRLVIMRPRQPEETRHVELPAQPTYHELDALIRPLLDGGRLGHVTVYTGAVPWLEEAGCRDMFVDDDGHAKDLPYNDAATALYLRNQRVHEPEKPDDPDAYIGGPAVLFPDRKVWF